jgi:hypothetical protein
MSQAYYGILGHIAESCDIQRELGCSPDEARQIQQQREDERRREYKLQQAETNVIQFRPRQ